MQSLITPEVMKYVKKRSEAMLGQYQFTHEDVEDIESEIYCELVEKANEHFEFKTNYIGYVGKVATLKIREIIRKRKCKKRDYRKCQNYLSDVIHDSEEGAIEYGDTLSSDQLKLNLGHRNYSDVFLNGVRADINEAYQNLPSEKLKEVTRLLVVYQKKEIASKLNISLRALDRLIEQIKHHFEQFGISKLF